MNLQRIKENIHYFSPIIVTIIVFYSLLTFILTRCGLPFYWIIKQNGNWQNNEVFKCNSVYHYEKSNGDLLNILLDKGTKTEALEKLIVMLDESPDILLEQCNHIHLTCKPVYEIINYNGNNKEEIFAYSLSDSICLNDGYIYEDSLIRELSNLYNSNHSSLCCQRNFLELNKLDSCHKLLEKNSHSSDNYCESWANLSALYWNDPELTNEICPEIYNYFEDIYC